MELFNLSSAEYAISNIALRRIKISRISDLNDPFELLSINVRDKELRKAAQLTRDQFAQSRGVICFSKRWSNPVLWSHYADKHRGMALGFEVRDSLVIPVTYEKNLRKIQASQFTGAEGSDEIMGRLLLATKFDDWRYEEEHRIFVDLTQRTSAGGNYFCQFDSHLRLTSVVLGARCVVPINRVRELVAGYPNKVAVKQARIAFTKFGVTEDKVLRDRT